MLLEHEREFADYIIDGVAERLIEANTVPTGRLIDAAELGERLGLCTAVIRRKGRELEGVKIGGRWRFDPKIALERHGQTTSPTPQRPRRRPRQSTTPLLPIRP
jgi:hypothetical protein